MIFRAGFALNTVGSFVKGFDALAGFCGGFLDHYEFLQIQAQQKAPVFLSSL